jgi:hypothetical protein
LANAPLNEPTGVRAALTITISSDIGNSFCGRLRGQSGFLALPHVQARLVALSTRGGMEMRRRNGPFLRFPQGMPQRVRDPSAPR